MKKMQFFIILVVMLLVEDATFAQVGINTNTPNSSSILDVTASDKGILFPRMTTLQKSAIATPADGLMVYDTDVHAHFIYIDGQWRIQKKEIVFPSRIFGVANLDGSNATINTPTGGGISENEFLNSNFAPVNAQIGVGGISGPQGAAIFSSGYNPITIGLAGTYLFKVSGRFQKSPANNLNMKARIILNVNGVNKLNTWFHLPNAEDASSTKTNYVMLNLVAGDVISLQVKKDKFTSTASATLHGIFSDLLLEVEKLP